MASSRSSSPVRSASPDRFELSPQSKIKKLLAAVDSDSDEDGKPRPTARKLQLSRREAPATDRGHDASTYPSDGDDDDEDLVRPKGRFATRMQGRANKVEQDARERVEDSLQEAADKEVNKGGNTDVEMLEATPGENGDTDEDDAPRPRRRLASRMQGAIKTVEDNRTECTRKSPWKIPAPDQASEDLDGDIANGGADGQGDEDDDDAMPVRSRKLKPRQLRSKTPESNSATPRKEASPGLFVTPTKSPPSAQQSPAGGSGSESDLPGLKSDRFKALVEKKRKERLAREAEEARKKEARAATLEELGDDDDDVSDITDDEGGRKLSQMQGRPSRKASKKALEEMNRETQRMQRSMQLAHEAKTKKKITKATLFERFNYNPNASLSTKDKLPSSSRPQTPASTKSTDAEMQDPETPPSSPPARVEDVLGKDLKGLLSQTGAPVTLETNRQTEGQAENNDEDFPDIMDMKAFARKPIDKGKAKAITPEPPAQTLAKPAATKRRVRVKLPQIQANRVELGSDDDGDDLVVLGTRNSKLDAVFDRVPKNKSKESQSLRALRQLAHLDSPERKAHNKTDKSAMTLGELQEFLQRSAREQAKLERERRLEVLKARGIHIQTEEERERDREQIEDMVARARREAEEIMDREREAAKKEKRALGKDDPLAWDDSGSDDDYEEEGGDEGEADVDLSGSEEEDVDEGMAVCDDADEEQAVFVRPRDQETPKRTAASQVLIDERADEASESEGSESQQSWVDPDAEEEKHRWGAESDEEMDTTPAFVQARRPKKPVTVVSDDEDLAVKATPKPRTQQALAVKFTPGPRTTSPEVPTSVLRSANKSFIPGLPVSAGDTAGLGLTQIFAGTMDSQTAPFESSPSQPMPTFDNFPDSQFSQIVTNSPAGMVLDSQRVPTTQQDESQGADKETQVQLDFTQSQVHGLDSLMRDDIATQVSEMMDFPTQDGGFANYTPLKERFVEPPVSTVETVVHDQGQLDDMSNGSPLLRKRGRLCRKAVIASDSEGEDDTVGDDVNVVTKTSVFDAMKDAAAREKRRKAREEFDRKKSKAKGMVEEQAEESEDEYAGLGGVDAEDSDDDDAGSVHEMIDDQTQGNKEDEAKLAAFFADRERADDEKQVEKLFHDVTTGMLRRKRGADYDLSDSDDGGEARRRMKRRQFAKMQKALFADERIHKVAENPRNQAFMRTIEDIGSDEEMDFLFEPPPQAAKDSQESSTESQDRHAQTTVPDSQPYGGAGPQQVKRAPAGDRRTKNGKKPANIGEIRETLSNLLDEPSRNTVISATDIGSDSEGNAEDDDGGSSNKENANPRRRTRHAAAVVDRISLKRQGSSNASTTSNGSGRMAFAAPSSSNGGFRVPALLRKATTNSLMGSSGSAGPGLDGASHGSAGGFGDEAKIRRNAGKRSGISYLARENDRQVALKEAEKRREQRKFRAVEGRGKVVGGLFGAGKFE